MMTNDKFTLLVHWRSVYTAAGMATGTATSTAADTSFGALGHAACPLPQLLTQLLA